MVLDILIDDQNKINRPCHLDRCSKIVNVTVKPYEIIVFTFTYIKNVNDMYQLK